MASNYQELSKTSMAEWFAWLRKKGSSARLMVAKLYRRHGFDVIFDSNLWKVKTEPAGILSNIINNQSPEFDSIDVSKRYYDFHLRNKNSPAFEKGLNVGIPIDLDGNPRPVGLPDLGCYERQ